MTTDKKPLGRLLKRVRCPECDGRIRKMKDGVLKCVGECGKSYEQMKLWESEEDGKQQNEKSG